MSSDRRYGTRQAVPFSAKIIPKILIIKLHSLLIHKEDIDWSSLPFLLQSLLDDDDK
jgi:hypothetical protein